MKNLYRLILSLAVPVDALQAAGIMSSRRTAQVTVQPTTGLAVDENYLIDRTALIG